MKRNFLIIATALFLFSCNNGKSVEKDSPKETELHIETENFYSFVYFFNPIHFPMEINDNILWKSTLVVMKGLPKIDTSFVNLFMNYEYETKDTATFHELITFYEVGKFEIDTTIIGLIYLKSFNSTFIEGGKKDIYKLAMFDKEGNLISQKDIAGFITDYSKNDDRSFWNTCKIDKNFRIQLRIEEHLADYNLDTLYVISKTIENYCITKEGIITKQE
ncbi:MAG: hypothetical protein LBM68_00735 [Bacteroidales bacterium]|jgi:hypothetical protein|nr:hypothetical protein [Bacteroidales bacterium]